MNSFEQIKLEAETKEIIDGYQRTESQEEIDRLNELDGIYGAKNPGEIDFWKTIWDEYNIEYDHGIPESYIPKTAIGALGLNPNRADDIADIGKEFALLVEAEPEAAIELDYIEDETDETILRLVLPEERPDLYLDNPKQYAERETWAQIWNDIYGDTSVPINTKKLSGVVKGVLNLETDAEVQAAIEVGQMSQAIQQRKDRYTISSERPKEYWINVWEFCNTDLGEPTSQSDIEFSIASKDAKPISEAKETVTEAIENGELYSPADAPDDHYTINDPATDDGPEINKDDSPDDDDDKGGDGQQHSSDNDPGDAPSDQSQSQDNGEQAITTEPNAENGTSPDTQTADAANNPATTTADTQTANANPEQSTTEECEEEGGTTTVSDSQSESEQDSVDQDQSGVTVMQGESPQNSSDSDSDQSGSEPSEQTETTQTAETAAGKTGATGNEETESSASDTTPTEEDIQAYTDENEVTRLQAKVDLNPPPEHRVKAAMAEVIEFCHQQIDNPIPENKEWNEDNPDAPYRKPETAREYFQDPAYDSESTPPTEFNPKTELLTSSDAKTEYDISQTASNEIASTTQLEISQQEDSDDDSAESATSTDESESETIVPYNYKTRNHRGWSPETIEEKKLGWAPRDISSLRDHLIDEGFTKKEIVATGVFNTTDDGTILPRLQCRYVFPYFNGKGEPTFLISRSINTDIPQDDGPDYFSPAKYAKPKNSHLPEPIYGTETIEQHEPLVITEGIADAITAHEHGIPCISPVTTQFKEQHYNVLYNLIIENDVPQVFIIQDADPPQSTFPEQFKQSYHDSYDPEEDSDRSEPETADKLWDALHTEQEGPGFEGAIKTARYLRAKAQSRSESDLTQENTAEGDNNTNDSEASSRAEISPALRKKVDDDLIEYDRPRDEIDEEDDDEIIYPELCGHETPDTEYETYIINLPRFGGVKYDLDDYLSDGMAALAPPAFWVSDILDFSTPTGRWIGGLEREDILRFIDPKNYTGDHTVGEVPGRTTGDHDNDSNQDSPSPLSVRATTLNYLPTMNGGDAPLGYDILDSDVDKPSMNADKSGSSATNADMWNMTLYDVFGIDEDYRGKSPFGHIGDSENYFVSMDAERAYDFKRKVTYTPSTGVLVKEGERYARDPEGSLSDWETFVYWRYLRENDIVSDKPPNNALIGYAKHEGIASRGDGLTTRDGEYGEFDALTKDALYKTLDDIEAKYRISVEWDPFGDRDTKSDTNKTGSGNTTTRSTSTESGSGSGGSTDQNGTSAGEGQSGSASSDQATSRAESGTESAASTRAQSSAESSGGSSASATGGSESDDTESSQPATTTPGQTADAISGESGSDVETSDTETAAESTVTVSDSESTSQDEYENENSETTTETKGDVTGSSNGDSEIDEDVDPIKQRHEAKRDTSDEEDVATNPPGGVPTEKWSKEMNSDGQHNKFKTYSKPEEDEGEFDPDREAVRQFVDGFCTVDESDKEELKVAKDEVFNAIVEWIKINEIEVDELSEDVYITSRKGNLTNMLTEEYGLESKQVSIDGERVYAYLGIRLSDSGEELLNMDMD